MRAIFLAVIMALPCCTNIGREIPSLDLKGTWVVTDFVNSLKSDRSAYKAYRTLTGVSCLLISEEIKDTTLVGVKYYNSSGGDIKIIPSFKGSSEFSVIDVNKSLVRLEVSIIKSDTLLIASQSSSKKKLTFKRASKDIMSYPLDLLSQDLFTGTYSVYDSTKGNLLFDKVILTKSGSIDGFGDYTGFNVIADYSVQPEELDLISITSKDKGKSGLYSYKFVDDGFYVYNINTFEDRDSKVGSVLYFFKSQ
jgi:hypothetical protein